MGATTTTRTAAATSPVSLGSELRSFARQRSPQVIAAALVLAGAGRVAVGSFGWRDLVGPAAVLALEPFTEWLIHVLVLHLRPRTVLGVRIDPLVAREHRAHHADPKDRRLVLVPLPVTAVGLPVVGVAVVAFARPLGPGLSAFVAGVAMLLLYEWTHFLIHSTYRPRSRYYRSIWRAHRLHHFRNERYWFGVTVNLADHLLRTFPARDAVPLSDTARTLGVS